MSFNLKNKIKNYGFWTSLGAAIIMFVQNLGNIFGFTVDSAIIDGIITGFCGILVVLGIVNNPTEGKWYSDTKKTTETETKTESEIESETNTTTENETDNAEEKK